jgi:hypothetical protein
MKIEPNKEEKEEIQKPREERSRCARLTGDLGLTTDYKIKEMVRKRNLEGTNLNLSNPFSALSDNDIVAISTGMGIDVGEENFEVIDLMKDLEIARHALESKIINRKNLQ